MGKAIRIALIGALLLTPLSALGEFSPAAYKEITQADLVNRPRDNAGRKFQVTDPFKFCGSDFCVQVLKTKINTRDYYCFALGTVSLVRMYLKKDHPDTGMLLNLKKGEKVTVYGTYDFIGSNYNYLVVDHLTVGKNP